MKQHLPENPLKPRYLGYINYLNIICMTFFVSLGFVNIVFGKVCDNALSPSPLEKRHELVRKRSLAIIKHQNQLRAKVGLPVFTEKDYEDNLKKKPPKIINSDTRYIIVKGELVLIAMDETFTHKSLKVDDVDSLNYVYRFEGEKLVEAIPAAIFYISEMDETVSLHRNLSESEALLWRRGNLKALRSNPKAIKYGYDMPVAHFSIMYSNNFYRPTISADVPRDVLLSWAKKKLITIGSEGDLHGKPYRIEIVIKSRAWDELLKYLN